MNDMWQMRRVKEKTDQALQDASINMHLNASESRQFGKRHFRFSSYEISKLLEILLPQYFDPTTSAIRTALWKIDPSWKKGQFKIFSRHFRMNLFRSFFTPRFLLNDAKVPIFTQEQILEKVLQASEHSDDNEKAAFYGTMLSEYILQCPEARFPVWLDSYKEKPNWIIIWNLHSTLWLNFYY